MNEPSVTDTINILRGLSERYSSYHGVRIADRALVVAAELSDRYITARFLPDKAIDLVDEACAALRVQLDSVPEDIDALQRRITALQVWTCLLCVLIPLPSISAEQSAQSAVAQPKGCFTPPLCEPYKGASTSRQLPRHYLGLLCFYDGL